MKILIETNENDYMTYFELASYSLTGLLKDYNLKEWTEKEIKDNFIELTKSYYLILRKERIPERQVERLYNDLEVYIGKAKIDAWQENDDCNGSEVLIGDFSDVKGSIGCRIFS